MRAKQAGESYDAVICIGCLIKGETDHYDYISACASDGISNVGLDTGVYCVYGVLNCLTEEQAFARAGIGQGSHNHGIDWALAAINMAALKFNP